MGQADCPMPVEKNDNIGQMTRSRRPPRKPNIFLILLVTGLSGALLIVYQVYWSEPYAEIFLEDPLDFDVPVSKGRYFESIDDDGRSLLGKPFSPETMARVQFLDEIRDSSITTFTNDEVVFVMYSSGEHFREAREGIRQLRLISNNTIEFYDLGLTSKQLRKFKNVCNLNIITYPYDKWPRYGRWLYSYVFKPVIWAEMYQKHSAFWIFDSSVRIFNSSELLRFYDRVRLGDVEPFTFEHPAGHSIDVATHHQMYDYLPLAEKSGKQMGMWQTGTMFIIRSKMAREIIKWSLLCALTKDCQSPKGARTTCKLNSSCSHRFDQSSASIIRCVFQLKRGLPCLPLTTIEGAFSTFANISRGSKYDGPLPTC